MKRTRWVVFGLTLALLIAPYMAVAQSLGELVQQGNAALEAKKYPEAEAIWRKVIQLDPNNAEAYYKLCDVLDYQNKIADAEAACRKSVQLNPTNSRANFLLGVVLAEQKKLDEAISQFRQAIALDPKYANPAFLTN